MVRVFKAGLPTSTASPALADAATPWVTDQPLWVPGEEPTSAIEFELDWLTSLKPPTTPWVIRDTVAWYRPAHYSAADQYGIHFDAAAVRDLARELLTGHPEIPEEDGLVAAFLMSHRHALVHAWVEDLCCLIEGITRNTHYRVINEKYAGGILMEEAIANTSAFGLILEFFEGKPHAAALVSSVRRVMSAQGPGYRDFAESRWAGWPFSEEFQHHMLTLLTRVYGYEQEVAKHAVTCFLGIPERWPRPSLNNSTGRISAIAMRMVDHPLFIHEFRQPGEPVFTRSRSWWRNLLNRRQG